MKFLKSFKLVAIAALCLAGWPSSSEAGLLFHRGCSGGQASAGCHGKQASAQQAGAGCVGAIGHGRYREVHRFRGRAYSYVQPSAPVAPPAKPPQPMPKSQSAATIEVPTIQAVSLFNSAPTRQELDARAQGDALEEVNAARSQRGLRPFQRDDQLMIGAQRCAEYRAQWRIEGHVKGSGGDFQFLPKGAVASAAGCAAWPPSFGWGSCCTYDRYSVAGAGIAIGADGKRYMQLFVR